MPEPIIIKTDATFSMSCRVDVAIDAPAETVWRVLTHAEAFPGWNSTVTRIEGDIEDGERIRIHVPGTARTFTPKVSVTVPGSEMIWTGGMAPLFKGVRRFSVKPQGTAASDFMMKELFSGLMIPLAKGSMPDFGPVFAQYASDLKREAERIANS